MITLEEAIKIVRDELLFRGDLYYGFLASIESALLEDGTITNVHDLAESILERIVGGEDI